MQNMQKIEAMKAALMRIKQKLRGIEGDDLKGKLSKLVSGEQLSDLGDETMQPPEKAVANAEPAKPDMADEYADMLSDSPETLAREADVHDMPAEEDDLFKDEKAPPRAVFKPREQQRPRGIEISVEAGPAAAMSARKRGRPKRA